MSTTRTAQIVPFPKRRPHLYMLTPDKKVVGTSNYGEWAASLHKMKRSPFRTRTALHVIHTSFIGIDASKDATPRLFDTMVNGPLRYTKGSSYCTYRDARRGHFWEVTQVLAYELTLLVLFCCAVAGGFEMFVRLARYFAWI